MKTIKEKPKVIVVVGPTGSGKTKLAIKLAKCLNGELINCDAFQVYKEIKAGTAQVTKKELNGVKIHLSATVSIFSEWNIKLFQEKAKVLITKIQKQKKQVILVGGSNLYINALIYNYDLSATKRDETFDQLTTKQLYEKVWSYSKDIANKNQNNRRRLIRALQILNQNKTLIKRNTVLFDSIIIECYLPRDVLYEKINANTLTMYRGGWKEEVMKLLKKYSYQKLATTNAFLAIGYLDILNHCANNTPLDLAKIQQKSRQYAKRQITWINHQFKDRLIYNQNNFNEIVESFQTKQ